MSLLMIECSQILNTNLNCIEYKKKLHLPTNEFMKFYIDDFKNKFINRLIVFFILNLINNKNEY